MELEYLDDLTQELELADEDELVWYKIAQVMVAVPLEEAQQRISDQTSKLTEEVNSLEGEMTKLDTEMSKLKVLLYKTFGDSINLEK
jgi:prefoldin subunit 4